MIGEKDQVRMVLNQLFLQYNVLHFGTKELVEIWMNSKTYNQLRDHLQTKTNKTYQNINDLFGIPIVVRNEVSNNTVYFVGEMVMKK